MKEATYNRYRFDALGIQASVEPAKVTFGKVTFGFADGRMDLSGTVNAAGEGGHLALNVMASGINTSRILAMVGTDASVAAGKIDGAAIVELTGKTPNDGLGTSGGELVLSMTGGKVARQFLESASTDARQLFRKAAGYASVDCLLGVANLHNGIASISPLRLRTSDGNTSRPYRRLVCAQGWRGGCARNQ